MFYILYVTSSNWKRIMFVFQLVIFIFICHSFLSHLLYGVDLYMSYICRFIYELYLCVYICVIFCVYILFCNGAPWKNSLTEWSTLYKYIWKKQKKQSILPDMHHSCDPFPVHVPLMIRTQTWSLLQLQMLGMPDHQQTILTDNTDINMSPSDFFCCKWFQTALLIRQHYSNLVMTKQSIWQISWHERIQKTLM